jgi:hypothetical protein
VYRNRKIIAVCFGDYKEHNNEAWGRNVTIKQEIYRFAQINVTNSGGNDREYREMPS